MSTPIANKNQMITLRPYQGTFKEGIYGAWNAGYKIVMGVMPTGGGKTAVFSSILSDQKQYNSCAVAHRQELVSQISMSLAMSGTHHKLIASDSVVRFCIAMHIKTFGKSYHHENSPVRVASVQTLLRRTKQLAQWLNSVAYWVMDEAHHVLPENQWGRGVNLFKNARGLGVTATPRRADNQPLGVAFGGLFEYMVLGPSPRQLMDMGFLADYRIAAPPASINLELVKQGATTGEYQQKSLQAESLKSTITGDLVDTYLKMTPGKLGISFLPSVEQAKEVATRFNHYGVPAEAVSGDTPDAFRQNHIERFNRGDIKQLVNVGLFGEGFDVPGVEVVSDGAATLSLSNYLQRFGRALRIADGKTHGWYLDHVGNVKQHGLPDKEQNWSLDIDYRSHITRKKLAEDELPVRTCLECWNAYEAITKTCPFCGKVDEPAERSRPEFVDGDLVELSPQVLEAMRQDAARVAHGQPAIPYNADPIVVLSLKKRWAARQQAQTELRDCINLWAGIGTEVEGRTESELYRIFWHKFKMDVLTAQAQDTATMVKMADKLREKF